jgi:replicative DNA helicase
MSNVPFYVDESTNISPADVRSRCRRLLVEHKHAKLGLIVIDYVSLMRPSANKNFASENETIAAISRELMSVKTEFECPILLLAQLNRECEKRPNKRPVLPDLRDSGALEQDANVVMFLYRDELYNEDSPDKGVAEVIIAKNRAGMQDTVRLAFQGSYQRFENLADHYQHQQGWN